MKKTRFLLASLLLLAAAALPVQAGTAEDALKAYNVLLSGNALSWSTKANGYEENISVLASSIDYALCDLDSNGVSELAVFIHVDSPYSDYSTTEIWSYVDSQVVRNKDFVPNGSHFTLSSYYPKTHFVEVLLKNQAAGVFYLGISKGAIGYSFGVNNGSGACFENSKSITRDRYESLLAQYITGQEKRIFNWKTNTKENRVIDFKVSSSDPVPSTSSGTGSGATITPGITITPGGGTAAVTTLYCHANEYVTLRSEPSTSANALGYVLRGESVTYVATNGSFYRVRYKGTEGYVLASYFSTSVPSSSAETPSSGSKVMYCHANEFVTLRSAASTSASALDYVLRGESVEVLGTSGSFYRVRYAGKEGYVLSSYFQAAAPSGKPASTVTPSPTVAPAVPSGSSILYCQANEFVTLRSAASTSANALSYILRGETVEYLATSGDFFQVRYKGTVGYVLASYFTSSPLAYQTGQTVYCRASDFVHLRTSPSRAAASLADIYSGAAVTYEGTSGEFIKVTYNGVTGYVLGEFFSADPSAPLNYGDGGTSSNVLYCCASDWATLRTAASRSASEITKVMSRESVTYISTSGDFFYVSYKGQKGYILSAYLSSDANAPLNYGTN